MPKTILLIFIGLISWLPAVHASPQTNQELMSTWINLESQRGHLKEDWLERKINLEQKIGLLEIEFKNLEEFLARSKAESTTSDQERQRLLKQQTALEQEQLQMEQAISSTLTQLRLVHPQLPPPLQIEWHGLLNKLTAEESNNSEKLEAILNLLKKADEFNNQVVLHKGPLTQTSNAHTDKKIEIVVNQVFLGLSQGWYVSDDGSYFGYGKPSATGWQWWPGDKLPEQISTITSAEEILEVVNILHEPTHARYLSLPVTLN